MGIPKVLRPSIIASDIVLQVSCDSGNAIIVRPAKWKILFVHQRLNHSSHRYLIIIFSTPPVSKLTENRFANLKLSSALADLDVN